MTSKKPLLGVALAGLLVLSTVTAVGAAGSIASEMTGNDLAVAVENVGNDGATVTVTQNGSAAENASVTVESESYAGAGEYATGENGTVSLPEPKTDVVVEVTAAKGDATDSTTATIIAGESDDEDEPGDGPDEGTFGQLVSSFVHEMLSAGDDGGPLGQSVSEFATENNPGNADENRPDHAGKPDHAGPGGDKDDADDENGTEVNGTDEDGERGPPDHAGPHDDENETEREDGDDADEDGGDETTDEETDDEAEEDDEETDDEAERDEEEDRGEDDEAESEEDEDDGSQGPPDHAGNGKGNGNGN